MKLLLPDSEVLRIYREKAQHLCGFLSMKLISLSKCVIHSVKQSCSFLVCKSNPLVVQLVYFVTISFAGFLALKNLKPQGKSGPKDLDLLFTSVSTLTVSSMATVDMEDLSDRQLWVLILLMLMGGEVFTSMLGLYFNNANANRNENSQRSLLSISMDIESNSPANNGVHKITECGQSEETMSQNQVQKNKSITYNPCAVLARIVTDARDLLKSKEINMYTFCIFTAVSSFANCGFTPLNSSMQPFRKNWVLLLLVIPQILAGNTLFSPLLRLSVWVLGKVSGKADAFGNVGYSLGYSCQKLLKPDGTCKDVSYGFVGRWTDKGKLIVILVMFLGRLKEFILK
uniref:HKT11 transporter n=1 Tax=Oryza punctata TaxID=4537 RepID=A0A0E0KUX8_ORYPU